jgi:hypothetical protein
MGQTSLSYEEIELIGKGSYGKVYKVIRAQVA